MGTPDTNGANGHKQRLPKVVHPLVSVHSVSVKVPRGSFPATTVRVAKRQAKSLTATASGVATASSIERRMRRTRVGEKRSSFA